METGTKMSLKNEIEDTIGTLFDAEIDEVMDWCHEAEDEGTHYPGMTYEQGIKDTLYWLSGNADAPNKN